MCNDLLSGDLLSTSYKKFWTVDAENVQSEQPKRVTYRKRLACLICVCFVCFFFI